MSVDVTDRPEVQAWKQKYSAMGLPDTLLNQMIDEANAEYNSTIGYGDIKRMAQLTVSLTDLEGTPDGEYVYLIIYQNFVIAGALTTATEYLFAQVPCISIIVQVVKFNSSDTRVLTTDLAAIAHTRDEEVHFELRKFDGSYMIASPLELLDVLSYTLPDTDGNLTPSNVLTHNGASSFANVDLPIRLMRNQLDYDITPHNVADIIKTPSNPLTNAVLDADINKIPSNALTHDTNTTARDPAISNALSFEFAEEKHAYITLKYKIT